ncbi:hypothetical protein NDU88_008905 [Pleurodeles waltl]|uniref:Uncharacterized protein n=1 Tax=Pleurodeles waltl TaxID=8319 RepID=A0AAV7PTI6_PLEWA|nr:hypothetical protein NDU88_008905 [Pleurodeles waltl]
MERKLSLRDLSLKKQIEDTDIFRFPITKAIQDFLCFRVVISLGRKVAYVKSNITKGGAELAEPQDGLTVAELHRLPDRILRATPDVSSFLKWQPQRMQREERLKPLSDSGGVRCDCRAEQRSWRCGLGPDDWGLVTALAPACARAVGKTRRRLEVSPAAAEGIRG